MKKLIYSTLFSALCCTSVFAQTENSNVSPTPPKGYKLVWHDEFDKEGKVNSDSWNFEHGFTRNHELQWYQEDNAYIHNGILTIEARPENRPNPNYKPDSKDWKTSRPLIKCTSSSINTRGKFSFKFGRMECRARIPDGYGSWPAIWLLGDKLPWPSNGEIDVMEYYRSKGVPSILANACWGSERPYTGIWNSKVTPLSHFTKRDPFWTSKFHIWRMDWDEKFIKIYLDDELLNQIDLSKTINKSKDGINPFHQSQYILLNLAISGDNGGMISPDGYPLRYDIDYVRVYQKTDNQTTSQHFAPVNPNATEEAKILLERLYKTVDDGQIISGLHHNQLHMPNYRRDLNRIESASAKEPLIWGGDVAWDAAKVVQMATEQYHSGHIITLMWHAARPYDTGIVNFKEQTQGKFSDAEWKELVTEGSEMHKKWIAQVDSISEYLKILQKRNIPVIWRPLHEMNGEWFWWGNRPGPEGYQKLWKMLYERMTNYHHLNNLIWVWNANAVREKPQDKPMLLEKYFPGTEYVDVLATDVYHRDWRQCHHDDLAKLGKGKLIALGELGSLPTPQQLANMPKFAWFMIWTDFTSDKYNSLEQINDIFSLPNVISIDYLQE